MLFQNITMVRPYVPAFEMTKFAPSNPLTFEPFEIRFLGRGGVPSRWVIDLSQNDDVLIHPQNYWTIANPEDRLFISEEYVPLFVSEGWQQQLAP